MFPPLRASTALSGAAHIGNTRTRWRKTGSTCFTSPFPPRQPLSRRGAAQYSGKTEAARETKVALPSLVGWPIVEYDQGVVNRFPQFELNVYYLAYPSFTSATQKSSESQGVTVGNGRVVSLFDEVLAYRFLEAHVWPDGPICPHCGGFERIGRLGGGSTRIGTYKCYGCRKPFTVKIGTIFKCSHVRLHVWLQAIYLVATSRQPLSANQLHQVLGVTVKTACFIQRRIDDALRGPAAAGTNNRNATRPGTRTLSLPKRRDGAGPLTNAGQMNLRATLGASAPRPLSGGASAVPQHPSALTRSGSALRLGHSLPDGNE
jgi:transposase-like protein